MEPFLGQLLLASFNFAPKGFAMANGQVLAINQNQALFSLFGTYFGGDGRTSFALPDLRGRAPIHQGNSEGSNFSLGQAGGEEMHTINANETPQHNHLVTAAGAANTAEPAGAFLGGGGASAFASLLSSAPSMNAAVIANAGGSQSHENRQPFLVMNWVVAVQGIFPSQN